MAKKNAKDLVKYVKTKIGNPYLYGFKQNYNWNKKCTNADYDRLKNAYGSMVWNSDIKCVGKYPCDCSGLISAFTGIIRGSSEYKSTATKTLPIKDITKAQPGCLLWKQGHIGVLISVGKKSDGSDSYYIAEDGSAYGCQKRPVSWQKWEYILWGCDLVYDKVTTTSTTKSTTSNTKTNTKVEYYKKYTGKSLSLTEALNSLGINNSFRYRAKIAKANGINRLYLGTVKQNTKLFNLLKKGKLIKVK